jgi:hypothetical protein
MCLCVGYHLGWLHVGALPFLQQCFPAFGADDTTLGFWALEVVGCCVEVCLIVGGLFGVAAVVS